jgi:uncharacterized protein YecT (DUF1311 family)
MMRWIAALFSLVACVTRAQTTDSVNCPGMTTLEINACVQAELAKVDGLLNQIYGIVIKELSAGTDDPDPEPLLNSERKRTLIAAERAWVKFKDAQCSAEYMLIAPGTGAFALSGQCAIDLTQERIRYLRRVEGQVSLSSKLCRTNKMACSLPPLQP